MRFAQLETEAICPFGQSVALYLFAGDALINHRLPEHVAIVVVGDRVGREDDVVSRRRTCDAYGSHVLPAADAYVAVHLLKRTRHIQIRLIVGVLRDGNHALYFARRLKVVGQLIRVRRKYLHCLIDDGFFLLNTEGGTTKQPDLFVRSGVAQHEANAVIAFGQAVALHLIAGDALIHHRFPEHLTVIRMGQGVRREGDIVARGCAVNPHGCLKLPAADTHVAIHLLKHTPHVEERLIVGILRNKDHALYLARRLEVVGQLVRVGRKHLHRLIDDGCFLFDPEGGTARSTGLFKLVHPSGFDKQPEANTIRSCGQAVLLNLFTCNTLILQSLFAKNLLKLAIRQRVGSKADSGRFLHVHRMRGNSRIRADPYAGIVRVLDIPMQII